MKTIQKICAKQKDFFNSGKTREYRFRVRSLKKLKSAVKKYENEIYQAVYKDLRKSEAEAFLTEYQIVLKEIDYFIKNLKELMKPEKADTPLFTFRSSGLIYREPYGNVLIIAPWNYPFQLALLPLAGALAAGNTTILKPSEFSAHTSAVIDKMITETFDDNYVAVIQGGVEESSALLGERFDYIFFTGSTKVGKIVMKAAAQNLTPVTLELGGKSPAIVFADADITVAARRIVWGKLINAGQTCIAPDYIYIEKKVKDQFIKEMIKAITDFYGENVQASEEYGRIISRSHLERLIGLVDQDKVVFGGNYDIEDQYLGPTIIDPAGWDDPVMQEEIFGPILPVLTFKNTKEIKEALQSKGKPLALYLFTNKQKYIDDILGNISFGGGCVNDTILHVGIEQMPFGGVGDSGMGAYHGRYSFETFSHRKSILHKSVRPDFDFRYPPYKEQLSKIKRFI